MQETTDDHQAIKEVLGGNSSQYRIVVEKYHRGLISYLYNMVHDGALAEDIAQEAFIHAYKKLETFNPQYSFSTWLYKIASNIAKAHFAKTTRTLRVVDGGLSTQESAEESHTANTRAQDVRDAISTLKPQYQQVINLFYWENKTYEEIATIVDCPVGTVRTWLLRSKEQLEGMLYGQV